MDQRLCDSIYYDYQQQNQNSSQQYYQNQVTYGVNYDAQKIQNQYFHQQPLQNQVTSAAKNDAQYSKNQYYLQQPYRTQATSSENYNAQYQTNQNCSQQNQPAQDTYYTICDAQYQQDQNCLQQSHQNQFFNANYNAQYPETQNELQQSPKNQVTFNANFSAQPQQYEINFSHPSQAQVTKNVNVDYRQQNNQNCVQQSFGHIRGVMFRNGMAPSVSKYSFSKQTTQPNPQPGNGHFIRQDSLAIASVLQEQDKKRTMIDFMETELDVENYLACFNEIDVAPDTVDFSDTELRKVHILYDDCNFMSENNAFPSEPATYRSLQSFNGSRFSEYYGIEDDGEANRVPSSNLNGTENLGDVPPTNPTLSVTGSSLSPTPIEDDDRYQMQCETSENQSTPPPPAPAQPKKSGRKTKKPAQYDHEYMNEDSDGTSSASSNEGSYPRKRGRAPKGGRKASETAASFRPQTKARKYNLKAPIEKVQPVYQLKRARNNDAVRKSRNKAKELQRKKDEDHEKMKKRIAELEGLLEAEKRARFRDREMIEQLIRTS